MNDIQKDRIREMRAGGYGYVRIAQELGISENTVKSFCRRKGLNGAAAAETAILPGNAESGTCPSCGKEVRQVPGRKVKKFCSDRCRNQWWNSHLDRVERKAHYEFVCACCKKLFTAYGNAGRKYCSHECYIKDRFGGGRNAE